jgi:3-hydroxyacyl-CoA dehydrogenase/enoyl-CoA hydratase/3-hydroxybutyryl-CoA epimerase
MKTIQYSLADGIATITFDEPDSPVNTMCLQWQDDMTEVTAQVLKDQDAIKGILLTSNKSTFFAGADLKATMRLQPSDAPAIFAGIELVKKNFRTLETLGKPVVSCLNGTALGGGWEVALIGHHRIAIDDRKTQFGLPEVTLGLLPGASGVTKMTRHLGLMGAQPYLVEGKTFSPAEAKGLGLVHALIAPGENANAEMHAAALAWIAAHPTAEQGAGWLAVQSGSSGHAGGGPGHDQEANPWALPCPRGHHGLHGGRFAGGHPHRAAYREPLPGQVAHRHQRQGHDQHLLL